MYFASLVVAGFFDTRDHTGLKCVAFFDQLIHALGIRAFAIGQALQIARLPSGIGSAQAAPRRRPSRRFLRCRFALRGLRTALVFEDLLMAAAFFFAGFFDDFVTALIFLAGFLVDLA